MGTWTKMMEAMWSPSENEIDFSEEGKWAEEDRKYTSAVRDIPRDQWDKILKERKK